MAWSDLSPRWKEYFVNILHTSAAMSKDENTQVGCLIIDTDNKVVISSGWNDLPRGVKHTPERNTRPLKYLFTSHAEQSCLTNALRLNARVLGYTMLTTLACCPQCSCSVVNSGISEVVTPPPDFNHVTYGKDFQYSLEIMREGGVFWTYEPSLAYARSADA